MLHIAHIVSLALIDVIKTIIGWFCWKGRNQNENRHFECMDEPQHYVTGIGCGKDLYHSTNSNIIRYKTKFIYILRAEQQNMWTMLSSTPIRIKASELESKNALNCISTKSNQFNRSAIFCNEIMLFGKHLGWLNQIDRNHWGINRYQNTYHFPSTAPTSTAATQFGWPTRCLFYYPFFSEDKHIVLQ